MIKRLKHSLLLIAVLLSSGASALYAQVPTLDSEEWKFLTLINNYRAQNGAGPLQVSVTLQNSSAWMSNDMATKNYFSHTDSLGRDNVTRVQAFGYMYGTVGENIAAGYGDAQTVFTAWQTACDADASGACTYAHRWNMLYTGYKAMGIGRATGASSAYGEYWTTDFGGVVDQAINPPATGTVQPPVISSFAASPASITAGQSVNLSWSVTGATSISINNGIGDVSSLTSRTVSPATTTTYTLTATDSAGSTTKAVTVTVSAAQPPAATPPTTPTLSSAVAPSATEVDIAWTPSTDLNGVTGYQIIRNGSVVGSVAGTIRSYSDLSVVSGSTYSYSVRAFDAAGLYSSSSNTMQVTTPVPAPVSSSTCPSAAIGVFTGCYYNNLTLSGTPALIRTDAQINFDWSGNVPDRSLTRGNFSVRWQGNFTFAQGAYTFTALASDGVKVYIDGTQVLYRWYNQAATQYSVPWTLTQGVHLVEMDYYEQSGTASAHLTWQAAGAPQTVTPPAILSFTASPSTLTPGQTSTLSWSVNGASSVAIDNSIGAVSNATSMAVTPSQTTTYTLTATNSGGSSTSRVTLTVNPLQDTQPPSTPNLVSAVAKSSTEVDLTWYAATDNVGVTGYQITRNGSIIGSVSGSIVSYADTAVTSGNAYTYSIKAFDAAGNYSSASNAVPVTTPLTPAPSTSCSVPATGAFTGCYFSNLNLSGTPAFIRTDPQINFDWAANLPDRSLTRGNYSARWQGNFTFSQGVHTFNATMSDGMRLYVDGQLILDRWSDQVATFYTVHTTLTQGTHLITVEYYEHTGWSTAHLSWQ
jgi:uncharacterized protein YkwD